MNRIHIIAWFIVIAFMLVGCNEDEGNYDYQNIGGVQVTFPQKTYSVLQGDTLLVEPKFEFTEGYKEDDFTYSWEAIIVDVTVKDPVKRFVLEGGTRLRCVMRLPFQSQPYKLYLYVTEKKNGVRHYFNTGLEVYSLVSRGWMVLCDNARIARIDMVSMNANDTVIRLDILTRIGAGVPELKDPVSLLNDSEGYCYNTKSGSYILNSSTLMSGEDRRIDYQMFSEVLKDFYVEYEFYDNQFYWMVSGQGDFYSKSSSVGGAGFGEPLNILNTDLTKRIRVAPYVAICKVGVGSVRRLVYDIENQRFMVHESTGAMSCKLITKHSSHTLFDYSNIGKELIAMYTMPNFKFVVGGQNISYAIFRDAANTYLYAFEVYVSGGINYPQRVKQVLPAEAQVCNKFVAYEKYGLLYYTDGHQVYGWNPLADKACQTEVVVPAGWEVTTLEYIPASSNLAVATYDPVAGGDSGVLTFYMADPVSGALIPTGETYSGLGKIVDVRKK